MAWCDFWPVDAIACEHCGVLLSFGEEEGIPVFVQCGRGGAGRGGAE